MRWLFALLSVALLTMGVIWLTAEQLSTPVQRVVGESPATLDGHAVQFGSQSGSTIRGWIFPGTAGKGAVLLLHGVRGDRRDMLSRVPFLRQAGYTVLAIDFQAHGESVGRRITFGYLESRDVSAALRFVNKQLPDERIGVIGESLGAAAFVLARDRPPVAAVVLESMYPTIDQALADRLRLYLGPLGPSLKPLLEMQLRPRLGVSAEQLCPINWVGEVNAPVFIMAGTRDRRTTENETRTIFEAAREPKQLWLIAGAAHVNLHDYKPQEYEQRVLAFFATYMRQR